ncbi:helix-turn-helix domain-containing protein [Kytococcus sedentarius]|uniref:helix-turn-helix domain-containing protein n=1 Tax=Kytococcus sedentarius TaxID=1276 RepID=UPI0035BBE5DD
MSAPTTDSRSDPLWTPAVVADLRAAVEAASQESVTAIIQDVAVYSEEFRHGRSAVLKEAVSMALHGFLDLIEAPGPSTGPTSATTLGARSLGRTEARAGRSVESVLAAYRVGARVCWVTFSDVALAHGFAAKDLQTFAALTFAYIDDLSAATVAGHTEERLRTDQQRSQARTNLGLLILRGARAAEVDQYARQAELTTPRAVGMVLCRAEDTGALTARLPLRTLVIDQVGLGPEGSGWSTLVLPDPSASEWERTRAASRDVGIRCLVTPVVDRSDAPETWRLASRWVVVPVDPMVTDPGPQELVDVLPHLVVHGDAVAAAALATSALAPLDAVDGPTRERLVETLRLWMLLRGQRSLVAAHLGVHPQTVRYRMTQVRELFGEELDDPRAAAAILLATLVSPPAGEEG